ncbi:MAG: S8 family serine peptidase [Planctomycetota bacterium]
MLARLFAALLLLAPLAYAEEESEMEEELKQKRNVILLGKTQLLNDARAYPKFCKQNANRKRSELRKEIVAKLKQIAAREQPKILKALGDPEGARSLWVVNAVAVSLTPKQIEQAKKLKTVKWVYPAGAFPDESVKGKVSEVLKPARREPFSAKKKKIPWNLEMLHVPKVWEELHVTGAGVIVAMLDAGVNYKHQDLRRNIWINPKEVANNGKDDDGNGLVDDLYGFHFVQWKPEVLPENVHHGTFTSSVVAGDGTGGKVTGVAPRARLMPLIAWGGPYLAARAYQYALEQGADVLSMSFSLPGLGNTRGLWRLMSEQACCAGLVQISGAGNFPRAKIPVQIRIPEGIPCVICAGGVTKKKKFPRFVSKGPVEWAGVEFYEDYPMPKGLIKPDVCAFPGPAIALCAPGDEGYLPDNNGRHGNSLSAPHVAGVCALILSAAPDTNVWRVKEILEQTAKDIPPRGKDNETGAGLMNAYEAVKKALEK